MTLDIRGARAVYVRDERREFLAYVLGAPDFVNATFVRRWISGAAPPALLTLDITGARAVYVQDERREFFAYVLGAPGFVNTAFARSRTTSRKLRRAVRRPARTNATGEWDAPDHAGIGGRRRAPPGGLLRQG